MSRISRGKGTGFLSRLAIAPIRLYQRVISPLLPACCIYTPTCSQYAVEAIEKYGVVQGCWLGARRIVRCNPLHGGGYDPVPAPGRWTNPRRVLHPPRARPKR